MGGTFFTPNEDKCAWNWNQLLRVLQIHCSCLWMCRDEMFSSRNTPDSLAGTIWSEHHWQTVYTITFQMSFSQLLSLGSRPDGHMKKSKSWKKSSSGLPVSPLACQRQPSIIQEPHFSGVTAVIKYLCIDEHQSHHCVSIMHELIIWPLRIQIAVSV